MRKAFRLFPQALGVIALALGTLMTPSCTKEYFSDVPDDDAVEMIISLGADTKTTNNGNSTLWADEDQLTVIHSAANGSDFTASKFSYIGSNNFSGKVSRLSSTNDWYVIYPYKEGNTAANALSFTFPASQSQSGNASKAHLAGEEFPLVGKTLGVTRGADLTVQTANLLAVARFNVTNKTNNGAIIVKEVQLTATSPIAGAFTVDLTGENPAVAAGSGATKVVKLTVEGGAQIAENATSEFYMAVAPFTAPAGSKLKLKVTAVHPNALDTPIVFYRDVDITTETSFTSGSIQAIGAEFDETHTTNPDAGSGTEVELPVGGEPEDGVYLLVYENGENSMAFAAFDEYKGQHYAIPVVVENGVVLPQDDIDLSRFAVNLENTGTEHPNDAGHDAYNVRNSEGKYVFYATAGGTYEAADALHILDSNEMNVQGTDYKYYHTFEQTTDGVRIVCSIATGGNKYLLSYTATDGFNYQQDNASGTNLHLYQIGEGSGKERQNPYFEPNAVDYDFDVNGAGVLANKPTLKDARTNVSSWESNNESVATVDASGNVTIHKAGSAIITAKLAADDTYYGATATYTINSTSNQNRTFYLTTEFEAGQEYLIVSGGKALTNNNGSIAATTVTDVNGEIQVANADASAMLWTVTSTSNGKTISNKVTGTTYYLRRASSNGSPSIVTTSPSGNYFYWTYSDNKLSTTSGTEYYFYYSGSAWAQSNSSTTARDVAIYGTTKPATPQNLSFAESTVIKIWGVDCSEGSTFPVQTVSNAQTSVTYTSSKTSVATINGTTIQVVGKGWTTITATAKEENGFKSATATYTLRINEPAPEGFKSLGTFNLENDHVKAYLTEAEQKYTDDNYTTSSGGSGTSIVASHTSGESETNRWDIPNPVKLEWDDASTGTTTITVYNDQALTDEVWTWTTTTENIKSYEVYNLIPGRTYYCTVVDDTGAYLLKGTFDTEGRRRMIKVSDNKGANYANNCRDLGGLETVDGHRIKYGMIYRGTNLTGTSKEERAYLVNFMNIGLDNDLRSGSGGGSNRDDPFHTTTDGHVNYGTAVDYHGPGYGADLNSLKVKASVYETMQAFIDCAKKDKASYFHCYIGSDRTGYWGLLIEGLLGVSPKDCSIDFELTGFAKHATGGDRPRNTSSYLYFTGMNDFKKMTYYTAPDTTDPYYTTNKLQYTITKYLIKDVGISWEDIQAFKEKVLE